jgi:protein-disulfide isomerase/uncharacterized membrane protein
MIKTWRIVVAIALILFGGFMATALWFEHHGESALNGVVRPICGVDATSGCEVVKQSAYSQMAGLPTAAAGVFYFASLLLLLGLGLLGNAEQRQRSLALVLALCALGVLFDLYLLGVQAFALHAYCKLCLLSYVGSLGGLIALWPARRALLALARSPLAVDTRLPLGAWAAGSLVLFAAVVLGEIALDDREVLSDPGRAEQYFMQKAVRRFEGAPVMTVDLSNAPTVGAPNAPIRAVVYSDFLCPWCRQLAAWLGDYLPRVQDRLSLTFKNYPLDQTCNPELPRVVHPGSCSMALGAVCAAEQGRFWPYHNAAFAAGLEKATRADALKAAQQATLDLPSFERCLDSPSAAQRLAKDIAEARLLGVTGTPTVVIDGKRLDRAGDLPLMVQVESTRLGLPQPQLQPAR